MGSFIAHFTKVSMRSSLSVVELNLYALKPLGQG
jgi:hypothetical protein